MPFVSKEMMKAQKAMEKEEEKLKLQRDKEVWDKLMKEEEQRNQAIRQRMLSRDPEINAIVDMEFLAWKTNFERNNPEPEVKILVTRSQGATKRAEILPKVASATGATAIINEDVMARVHRFKVLRHELGRGKTAVIYKAEDPNGQTIAVKVTTTKTLDASTLERYLASLPLQRFLKDHPHPNILPILEIFSSNDKIYVFTELASTDMLKKIKKEGPFPEGQALTWAKQVAQGLQYLHESGIAHERIRPGHVVLDSYGTAKICGFGWMTLYYDFKTNQFIKKMGSSSDRFHHFYAPEVMLDDWYAPQIADIWSLGTLITIMITKDWPFEKRSTWKYPCDIMWKMCFKRMGVPLTIPVHDILASCFVEKPEDRADIYQILALLP